jgi:hypothetical protein
MRRLLLLPCLALLLVAAAPARAADGPAATTLAASPVGQNTATVRGTVDPNGAATSYRFEYGTSSAYGLSTADTAAGSGTEAVDVQEPLSGLSDDTTYHYRVLAWPDADPTQVTSGADRTFRTIALPIVSTGSPRDTRPDGTTFVGKVDPNRSPTRWYFEWGTTQSYGNRTPEGDAGRGSSSLTVSAVLAGLAPNTTYHVRIVATNAAGIKRGRDRGFKTLRQPSQITIAEPVQRVFYGGVTMIDGQVQGAGVNGIRVALEAQPFPFTAPFATAGDSVATASDGTFHLATPPLFVSTRLHVVTRTTPPIVSPAVTAFTELMVRARAARVDKRRYRVLGTGTPDVTGARVSVQRRSGRRWVFVHRTTTSRSHGRVGWQVVVRRAAKARTYRVLVTPRTAAYVRSVSNTVRVPKAERKRRR